ncbi:MAG: ComEC/Rec2 family competence protein [Kiritimatiellae bacterium]|nr:ComEC/Rec2 family competence protein [Kiritimatiellia bacterium]
MRRPILGLFFVSCCGSWVGLHAHLPIAALGALACVSLLSGLAVMGFARRRERAWGVAPVCLLFLTVFLVTAWRAATCSAVRFRDAATISIEASSDVELTGVVLSNADEVRRSANGVCRRFRMRVRELTHGDCRVRVRGVHVQVDWWSGMHNSSPLFGRNVRLTGSIKPLSYGEVMPPFCWTMVSGSRNTTWMSDHSSALGWHRLEQNRRAAARLLRVDLESEPRVVGVLQSMLLGYRERLDRAWRELFVQTGTVHIFAISGLHVGIVTLIIVMIARFAGVPRGGWLWVTVPLIVMYTVATGSRPSAVRACIMAALYMGAFTARRKPDALSALGGAGILSLALRPQDLVSVGFVLSFSVVAGLIVFYPVLDRLVVRFVVCVRQRLASRLGREQIVLPWEHDPFDAAPILWRERVAAMGLQYFKSLLILSLAAWLISAPLTAFYFGRLTGVAILSNIVIIPMTFLIVLSGCLSILVGAIWPGFALVFNNANWLLIHTLIGTMHGFSMIPGGSIQIPPPPLWLVLLWYLMLLAALKKMDSVMVECQHDAQSLGMKRES